MFLLSAFLLSLPFFKAAKRNDPISIRNFFIKRFLRIVPMYLAVLICAVLITGKAEYIPRALFLPWGLYGPEIQPFSNVWWSLNTETQFYLMLPLLGFALNNKNGKLFLLIAFLVYCILYILFVNRIIHAHSIQGNLKLHHTLLGRGYIFIFGIATAWWYANYGDVARRFIEKNKFYKYGVGDCGIIILVLFLGALLSIVFSIGYFKAEINYYYWHIAEVLLWNSIMIYILFVPLRIKFLISNKALMLIGKWSYSIYLTHLIIITYIKKYLGNNPELWGVSISVPSISATLMAFSICIIVSITTYNIIEKPFLELKKKYQSNKVFM